MARTTKEQLQTKFEHFVEKIGGRVAKKYNDVGGYTLDYQSCYGGWVIEQVENDAGSISHPFGPLRRSAGDLWDMMDFSIKAMGEASHGK